MDTSDLLTIILQRIDVRDDCWIYNGHIRQDGYGFIGNGHGIMVRVHRIVYEAMIGPIPDGLHTDHLCRNRACCNPDHIEPVTSAENTRRGEGPAAVNARKTECIRGHPFDEENTYHHPNGTRKCRTCISQYSYPAR